MGIAIHFTNSLDFFTFSNFPFAYFLVYFLAYFLYISIHSSPFSSYCNPPTHSFHILSSHFKHPFYPTSPFSFHPKSRHFLSIFILQLFFYFLSIHTIPPSLWTYFFYVFFIFLLTFINPYVILISSKSGMPKLIIFFNPHSAPLREKL